MSAASLPAEDGTNNTRSKKERTPQMNESKYKSYDDLPLMLSVPEVAEVLGIGRAHAYELVKAKGFPSITIGMRIIVPKDEFIVWIKRQTSGTDE